MGKRIFWKTCKGLTWLNHVDSLFIPFARRQVYKCSQNINRFNNSSTEGSLEDYKYTDPGQPVELVKLLGSQESRNVKPKKLKRGKCISQIVQTEYFIRDPLHLINKRIIEKQNHRRRRSSIEDNLNTLFSDSSIEHREEDENEFNVFGRYIALQLESLDPEFAVLAQDEIQSIITNYKLKKLRSIPTFAIPNLYTEYKPKERSIEAVDVL